MRTERGWLQGMRSLFPAMLLLGAAMPATAATRSYIVTDYDSLRVEGPLDVTVETGRGASARGEGDRAALDAVELRVSARVLTVRFRATAMGDPARPTTGPVRLILTTPTLRRVQLSGTGTVRADGLEAGRAEIALTGSGRIEVQGIDSDTLLVSQSGGGALALAGRAKDVRLRLSGSGSLNAAALRTADLDLGLDGSGSAEAQAERTAKVMLSGSGSVIVAGRPACTVRQIGSGTVRCGDARP